MKWNLVYFDSHADSINLYKNMLQDKFNVVGHTDFDRYSSALSSIFPHALMIDVKMNGFALCDKVIHDGSYNGCPIFFISDDKSVKKDEKFFKSGAVDFLSRDLPADEVVLRLTNKIKFYFQTTIKLELGNLFIDMDNFKTTIDNNPIDLTLLEIRILSVLIRNYPESISRENIIRKIWGREPVKPGTINTHLSNMKQKVEDWTHSVSIRKDQIFVRRKEF